jgi:pimeloyl-ACP methyl ester carboxylesterase
MHERTVKVDGRQVGMYHSGEGPPVVLLHGLLGSPHYLLPLARALAARGRRVIVPWLPGHGPSQRLEPFTFEAAADVLAAAVEQLAGERPALVGHSYGAPVVVTWAARRPVSSVVAVSPVGVAPVEFGPALRLMPAGALIAPVTRRAAPLLAASRLGRRVVFGWFVGMHRPHAVDRVLGARLLRAATTAEPALATMIQPLVELDLTIAARRVTCPALVVWGQFDRDGEMNGPGLAAALRSDQRVLPAVGHMPMLEAPFAFRVALDGFV